MKIARTLGLALLWTALPLHAQITVTNSVFPVIGDKLHYAFGNQPGAINVVFTPPGGGQVWDLSGLQAHTLWDEVYRDPATGAGAADFPGAAVLLMPFGAPAGQEDYLSVSANQVARMGSHGADPIHIGASWTVHQVPGLMSEWAPTNFFDIQQSISGSITNFLPSEMPPGTVDQLGANIDSMRVRATIGEISTVDAYGTMLIPGGSYPVLRMKRTTYRERRLDAKVMPLGWLDITGTDLQNWDMADQFIVDTLHTFYFINDQSKETIAVCDINHLQNEVTQVRYKSVPDISTATGSVAAAPSSVRVFPNPASERICVIAANLEPGTQDVCITDATGREMIRKQYNTMGPVLPFDAEVSGLNAGIYNGTITDVQGRRSAFRFVKN